MLGRPRRAAAPAPASGRTPRSRAARAPLEVRRLHERRDAEQRRQATRGVNALAVVDLGGERQRRAEVRVDAARALRLAGRHAQQPAVVEQLPLRLQRVEARLLDAGCGAIAAISAPEQPVAERRTRPARSRPRARRRPSRPRRSSVRRRAARIGGGLTMSKTRNSRNAIAIRSGSTPTKKSTSRNAATSSMTMLPWSATPRSRPVTCADHAPIANAATIAAMNAASLPYAWSSSASGIATSVPNVPGANGASPLPKPSAMKCAGCANRKRASSVVAVTYCLRAARYRGPARSCGEMVERRGSDGSGVPRSSRTTSSPRARDRADARQRQPKATTRSRRCARASRAARRSTARSRRRRRAGTPARVRARAPASFDASAGDARDEREIDDRTDVRRSRMWPRSPVRPSETSSAADATPRSASPSATRGSGTLEPVARLRERSGVQFVRPSSAASASAASPSVPDT